MIDHILTCLDLPSLLQFSLSCTYYSTLIHNVNSESSSMLWKQIYELHLNGDSSTVTNVTNWKELCSQSLFYFVPDKSHSQEHGECIYTNANRTAFNPDIKSSTRWVAMFTNTKIIPGRKYKWHVTLDKFDPAVPFVNYWSVSVGIATLEDGCVIGDKNDSYGLLCGCGMFFNQGEVFPCLQADSTDHYLLSPEDIRIKVRYYFI
jgi:hypothetical protein